MKLILLILIILVYTPASFPRNPDCDGTPIANEDPFAFLQWVKHNGNLNKKISDVICCMPVKFRSSYKVSHSSVSAQAAHYKSPRLIFGNLENDNITFSISGGDPTLPQSNSIEIIIDRNDELELYDVEFGEDGKKHGSKKNPELCMSCHGNFGELTAGGPRVVFSKLPWQRMTTQAVGSECTNQGNFQREARRITYEAIEKNPRFRCLPSPGPENDTDIFYDEYLERINFKRVIVEMNATPDFRQIRNFIMGVKGGCLAYYDIKKLKLKNFTKVEQWFSDRYLNENDNLVLIKRDLINAEQENKVEDFLSTKIDEFHQQGQREAQEFQQKTQALLAGEFPTITTYPKLSTCESIEGHKRGLKKLLGLVSSYPKNVRLYIYDMVIRSMENGRVETGIDIIKNGLVRWAFESRGLNIVGWDMSLIPNYSRNLLPAIDRLEDYLDLRSVFANFERTSNDEDRVAFAQQCSDLMLKTRNLSSVKKTKKKMPKKKVKK